MIVLGVREADRCVLGDVVLLRRNHIERPEIRVVAPVEQLLAIRRGNGRRRTPGQKILLERQGPDARREVDRVDVYVTTSIVTRALIVIAAVDAIRIAIVRQQRYLAQSLVRQPNESVVGDSVLREIAVGTVGLLLYELL